MQSKLLKWCFISFDSCLLDDEWTNINWQWLHFRNDFSISSIYTFRSIVLQVVIFWKLSHKEFSVVEKRILLNFHVVLWYVLTFVVLSHEIWCHQTLKFSTFFDSYNTYLFDNIVKLNDTELKLSSWVNWTFKFVKSKLKIIFELWNISKIELLWW